MADLQLRNNAPGFPGTVSDGATDMAFGLWALPDDLGYLRTLIVNVYFFGAPGAGDRAWVLIDAGIAGSATAIARAAAARFGPHARPSAIVLTHGHFDHVGAVRELAAAWDVPVYAHPLELPYLTGRSAYPPPDPSVGGGAMAALSWFYPRGPIDLGDRVRPLPEDGSIPGMPDWRWVHTPGHAPGHVSFFRDRDRTLIAGDAVITVKQESALAVLLQRPELHGPPMYYTPDWDAARRSVRRLADLGPRAVATGHGVPVRGAGMGAALHALADDFERMAVPAHGRYVGRSAVMDEHGVVTVPPPTFTAGHLALWGLGALVVAGVLMARSTRGRQPTERRQYREPGM